MPGGTALAAESIAGSSGAGAPNPRPPPPPPPPPPPRPPRPAGCGLRYDGRFTSAPALTRMRIASTSNAYAARQNAVVPSTFSRPQLALPQLLNAKYQGCAVRRAFGSAPA